MYYLIEKSEEAKKCTYNNYVIVHENWLGINYKHIKVDKNNIPTSQEELRELYK